MRNFLNNQWEELEGYDLTEHQRLHKIELWKKSKAYDWHHRVYSENEFSFFYYTYKQLLFLINKIKLRNHIIGEFCKIVSTLSNDLFGQRV